MATAAVPERDLYLEALDRWNLHGIESALVPEPIADLIREGVPPAPMLLEDWLYEGELHWFYAEAEAGKTWLALILALDVMKQGSSVAWFDEELGKQSTARRLIALGADADLIEEKFAYFDYPNLTTDDADTHRETLEAIKPALVVYDTATDMLTAAGLDENSGRDVTAWVKAFPEQARQLNITQIVCDHTAKGGDTAVGSRAKRAKAKVQYYLKSQERWDDATVGRVRVKLTKNTPGNALPQERDFRIGGTPFTWELAETHVQSTAEGRKQGRREAVYGLIQDAVNEHGPLTQTQLRSLVPYGDHLVLEVAAEMVKESHVSGVAVNKQGNRLIYSTVEKAALPA